MLGLLVAKSQGCSLVGATSLAAESRGCSLVGATSLVAESGLLSSGGYLSSCRESGLLSSGDAWAPHCSGSSRCRAWALGTRAAAAVVHRLTCPTAPHLPALASGFLTTILPEKS